RQSMSSTTETKRAPEGPTEIPENTPIHRILGSPAAFIATAVILLALFGGTFLANPDRVAPTKDPAYYTWRTELMTTETPQTLLDTKGPYEYFSSGYRVVAPISGGLMRGIPGVSELHTTVFFMVLLPVLTSLLLASFAYRHRRDPLLWHAVAYFSASLYLTPPFVGYLDNVLCLFFVAASLSFLTEARTSWPARLAFSGFLVGAGLTHPTTLVFFGLSLGLMSLAKLVFRRFDLRAVLREDLPMLLSALAAAIVTVAIWTIGIWGEPAPLTDAALAPPYDSDFFLNRMGLWIDAMRPWLNGPLLVVGVVGILAAGKRWVDEDLARVSILWLAPLAGLFGFIGGLTYPYYRFFNTTLAWLLLVGLGAYFLVRFLMSKSMIAAGVGLVLLGLLVATNFTTGFELTGWNNAQGGWINAQTRTDLEAVEARLAGVDEDTPVIFAIDQEDRNEQIWGYTKLSGNTSRYGLPDGMIDQGYMYLGSLENLLQDSPTDPEGEAIEQGSCDPEEAKDALSGDIYTALSRETLCDVQDNAAGAPIIVVAQAFNATGFNAEIASGAVEGAPEAGEAEVWVVAEGEVTTVLGDELPAAEPRDDDASPLHLLRVLIGFLLLLLPGALAFRFFLPDGAPVAEGLGMAPALSFLALSLVGMVLVAVIRAPFDATLAWTTLVITTLLCAGLHVIGRRRPHSV
ncbi:MAG TPA: hypothetical protein VFD47_13370, partial [Actinomycetota bacterium]|nr:hypothetical protein [Actinomycetota bacterium]